MRIGHAAAVVVAQKGRQRRSAGNRGVEAAGSDAEDAEDAEGAADADQAVAEGRAKARGTEDAGSWLGIPDGTLGSTAAEVKIKSCSAADCLPCIKLDSWFPKDSSF